jgi:hypothetical protein
MNFNYRDFFIHNDDLHIIKEQSSEETGNDNDELAQKFCNEFLQYYKVPQSNSHNCAWTTQQFIKWAKSKGINAKAIYLVWPDKPNNAGESHIAPIVNNTILDFTYNQFDKSFDDCALLTNVNNWKEVYKKFGYGTNTVKINGKDQGSFIIDTFDNLKNVEELDILSSIVPSLLNV